MLVCGPHELGLLSAGLGTPGSQHQAYQDDHQDQDGDDGQEYPDQGSHFDSLKLIMFSLVLHFCYSLENFYTISLLLKKIMWKLSSSASEFRHKVSLSFVGIAFIIRRQRAADVGRIQSKFSNLDSLFSRGGQH